MDLFVVPTLGFSLLYGSSSFDRRELVWIGVTNSSMADWIARRITDAFSWGLMPWYLIREPDRVFGSVVFQGCAQWAFGQTHRSHGRTILGNVRLGPFAANVWTTSLSLARRIFPGYCSPTHVTITEPGDHPGSCCR
jgi:hypothetical protein